MKLILYTCISLLVVSFTAKAQSKNLQLKQKYNFMLQMHRNQNLKNANEKFNLKINPYWQNIDAPHTYNSYLPQIKVPCYGTVWAKLSYDSTYYDANQFLRTADNGKTWKQDSIDAPAYYGLCGLSAIDANTCYAAMFDAADGLGGGIFKTTDGGDTWKQLGVGKIFDENSFPDFVYFFDDRNGLAVGDNNGDASRLEIYTTCDAGKTWQRVPDKNIPATSGEAYSFVFNAYTVFQNRIWVKALDSYGNNYVYRSDDRGQHWKLFPYTLATPIFDWAFTDKNNGLGVSFDFFVAPHEVETHDGGATWADKSFTGYPMGGFITVIPGTHTFVTTLPTGLTPVTGSSYSHDFGTTWHLIDSGVNANHSAVAFLNPILGWTGRAETFTDDPAGGMFKWKYRFSLDNDAVANNNTNNLSVIKNDNIKAKLYPNPAKDMISVEGLDAPAKTTLSLSNSSGNVIRQVTVNSESFQFNIHNLIAGSYYIKIQSGEKITTLKFVKE